MKKKLNLKNLKLTSFTTTNTQELKMINGGNSAGGTCPSVEGFMCNSINNTACAQCPGYCFQQETCECSGGVSCSC